MAGVEHHAGHPLTVYSEVVAEEVEHYDELVGVLVAWL